MTNELLLLARLFLGIPFIVWGWMKLTGGEAKLVPGLSALGLPDALFFAYLIGLCELLGGLAVTLGYPARTASTLLGLWCLITGFQAHRNNITELLKNSVMAGGYFGLCSVGPGSLTLFHGSPYGVFSYLP